MRWFIVFDDGRYLAIGYDGTCPRPMRVAGRDQAWSWESRAFATMLGLRLLTADALDWRVVPSSDGLSLTGG